jgi:hypothetical protein
MLPSYIIFRLNEEWVAILSWAEEHDLEVNTQKTKVMTVKFTKRPVLLHTLVNYVNGSSVEEVTSLKLLGLIITNDLKWNMQVDNCIMRANIFLLRQLKYCGLSNAVLWNVYNALIRSLITYAAPTTLNISTLLREKLIGVEKRVSRVIGSSPPISLCDFVHQMCIRLIREIKANDQHPLRHLFQDNLSVHATRHQCALLSPFANTSRLKNSFIKYAVHT